MDIRIIPESGGQVTFLNVITVDPMRQGALVALLTQAMEEAMQEFPGLISYAIHKSIDGMRVANYSQWRSRESLFAMLGDERAREYADKVRTFGSYDPHLYEVVHVGHR